MAGLLAVAVFPAKAQVTVTDDGFSLVPDPVHIVAGQAVSWQDNGSGPFQIISDTGAWTAFFTPGGILFDQPGTYSYHDDAGNFGTVSVTANVPPTVTITNPVMNAVFAAPATFLFAADASDPDADGLSDVQFYVGPNLVDDVFSSPFTTTVTNLAAGTYLLKVIAYDNVGGTATNSITISVQAEVPITLTTPKLVGGQFQFTASGLTVGKTNVLQVSTNLNSGTNWIAVSTNMANASTMSFTNVVMTRGFFRLVQLP